MISVPCRVVTKGSLRLRWAGGQHLPRQQRAYRMRNRVVHVQQVEIVKLGHFGHARGQGQIVGRIVEQRVARNLDFVIMNMGLRFGQADGLRVRDEMNLVSALSQLQAQFGGHHAAAAVGRDNR